MTTVNPLTGKEIGAKAIEKHTERLTTEAKKLKKSVDKRG